MDKKTRTRNAFISFFVNISLIVLMFIGAIYLGVFLKSKRALEQELKSRAGSIVHSLVLARNWNASFGGVYVEKTPGVISNPFLKDPDIETKDGRIYTKKNPALMIREISEKVKMKDGFEFRITSLHPVNPDNRPDPFERRALNRFERGEQEVFTRERLGGSTFFRYMEPLLVESDCLKCHDRGYQVGDVRGGISVRFNIDHIEAALSRNLYTIIGLAVFTFGVLVAIIQRMVLKLYRKLRMAETKLQEMAITDELTGLKNRRYLVERLGEELKQARRYGRPVSCILFDLDHFKRINDRFGHDMGDKVLRTVARTAIEQFRETDIVSRFGGEEFLIILPNTDLAGAAEAAERLRQAIIALEIPSAGRKPLTFTASFGLAMAEPRMEENIDDQASLLKRADDALYRAKGNGRNRVEKDE